MEKDMREMSQEEFLKILDSRPEGSLENLNLRPEDLLIPNLSILQTWLNWRTMNFQALLWTQQGSLSGRVFPSKVSERFFVNSYLNRASTE